mgnify:CR=1 FL=1
MSACKRASASSTVLRLARSPAKLPLVTSAAMQMLKRFAVPTGVTQQRATIALPDETRELLVGGWLEIVEDLQSGVVVATAVQHVHER